MAANSNMFSALAGNLASLPTTPAKQKAPKPPAPKATPKAASAAPVAAKAPAVKAPKQAPPAQATVPTQPPPSGGPDLVKEFRDLKGSINKLIATLQSQGPVQPTTPQPQATVSAPGASPLLAPTTTQLITVPNNPLQGANQQPLVAIPAPIVPPKSPLELVMEYIDNYVLRVPAEYVDKVTNQLGFNARPSNPGINGVNPHELAAAARRVATLYAIRHLVRRNHWKIDAYYGNFRDEGFASAINAVLVDNGHPAMLEINIVGGWVVANDMRRRNPDSLDIGAKAGFSMDVYSLPSVAGQYTPVTPEAIAQFGYDEFCWVGHEFHDLWGAMDTVFWHRNGDTVTWFSDSVSDPYEPHDACDDLHHGGSSATHTWTIIKSWTMSTPQLGREDTFNRVKTYDVLSVVKRAVPMVNYLAPVKPIAQSTFDTSVYDRIPLRKSLEAVKMGFLTDTIADFLIDQCNGYALPTVRVRVSKHHFLYAKSQFVGRTKNRLAVGSVRQFVNQMCNNDAVYSVLERNYPDFFMTYREDVVMAVTTHASQQDADRANDARRVHAQNFNRYNESLRNMDTPIEPSRPWFKIFLAIASVVFIHRLFRHSVATADAFGGLEHNLRTLQLESSGKSARATVHSAVDKTLNFLSGLKTVGARAITSTLRVADPRVWFRSAITMLKWLGFKAKTLLLSFFKLFMGVERASQGVFNNWDFPTLLDYFKPKGVLSLIKTQPGMVFQTVVLRPVLEEVFKKNFGIVPGSLLLSTLDVVSNLDLVRAYQGTVHDKINVGIESWVTCLSIHLACAVLPTPMAALLHSSFNASMLTRQSELGLLAHRRHGAFTHGSPAMAVAGRATLSTWNGQHVIPCSSSAGQAIATAALTGNVGPLVSFAQDLLPAIYDVTKSHTPGQLPLRQVNPIDTFDGYWYKESTTPQGWLNDHIIGMTAMEPRHDFVEAVTAVNNTEPDKDPDLKSVQTSFFAEEEDVRSGYYRIYGVSTPMFKPAKTGRNAMYLVTHRLTKAIPYRAHPGVLPVVYAATCGTAEQRLEDAAPVLFTSAPWDLNTFEYLLTNMPERQRIYGRSRYTPLLLTISDDANQRFQLWLEHTDPSKRRVYMDAWNQNIEDPLDTWHSKVRGIQVNIKCDEVLLKPDWVPRPIDAVHPRLAVELGVEVYDAQLLLKNTQLFQQMGSFPIGDERIAFTLTYGAGRNADSLSHWFCDAVRFAGMHAIVAGDDSLVVINHKDHITIIESDVSQNDHSIRLPMLMYEWMILADAGMPTRAISLLAKNAAAPRIVTFRNSEHGNVIIHREPERNTGGTDTTVGNTLASQAGWLVFAILFSHYQTFVSCEMSEWVPDAVHDSFSKIGLSVKTRVVHGEIADLGVHFWPGSFLKGTWWLTADGWVWSVLPSRFIKVSKMLSDPRKVYRLRGEQKLTMHEARLRHMCALAKSLLPFAMPPELFGWLKSFLDLPVADQIQPLKEDIIADWKPMAGRHAWSILSFTEQTAAWYGVEQDMVTSWLEHVVALKPGVFSHHPMWEVMAKRDYC